MHDLRGIVRLAGRSDGPPTNRPQERRSVGGRRDESRSPHARSALCVVWRAIPHGAGARRSQSPSPPAEPAGERAPTHSDVAGARGYHDTEKPLGGPLLPGNFPGVGAAGTARARRGSPREFLVSNGRVRDSPSPLPTSSPVSRVKFHIGHRLIWSWARASMSVAGPNGGIRGRLNSTHRGTSASNSQSRGPSTSRSGGRRLGARRRDRRGGAGLRGDFPRPCDRGNGRPQRSHRPRHGRGSSVLCLVPS